MNGRGHMSYLGVGPTYVFTLFIITVAAIMLSKTKLLTSGFIGALFTPFQILGSIFLIFGIFLWFQAVFVAAIRKNISENKLLITGVYGWVRNPMYSGFSMIFTGILFLQNNLFLLITPILFWLLLTILVKKEEILLENLFGQEYLTYKNRVNRFIPWFPKK